MKTYLHLTPNENGTINEETNSHFEVQGIPEGWVVLPDELLATWNTYKPFVTLTVVDSAITAIADNPTARAAQEAIDAAAKAAETATPTIEELATNVHEALNAIMILSLE